MEEIINSAGGNENLPQTGEAAPVAKPGAAEGGKGASVKGEAGGKTPHPSSPSAMPPSPQGEGFAGRLQNEGGPSSAAVSPPAPRDDVSGAEGSVIPSAEREEPPASSSRLQREGDPSSSAVSPPAPRDDRGAAVTFAARSARLADEAEALYAEWTSAAKELSRDYPGFDLAAAAKEPAFGRLLRAGIDLRSAYEATHMPLVREAIRASAAAEAEARALDGVRLRGLRPDENGARPGGAVITGGMAGLSREQRARIAEKAMRGLL